MQLLGLPQSTVDRARVLAKASIQGRLMPAIIVVGTQWGDEGKGKIVDLLTSKARHVVRAQGGNYAGHTVFIDRKEFKLRIIPSGIVSLHTKCYLGAGCVVDPKALLSEIEELESKGISLEERLWVSHAAHVIFPFHKSLDRLSDEARGEQKVGTTGRGIGPCYADKMNRIGIRMGELLRPDALEPLLKNLLKIKNNELMRLYEGAPFAFDTLFAEYSELGRKLIPYVKYIEGDLEKAIRKRENVLFEAAQGTFLDISLGTYPYVTSSNTTAGGVCCGAGIGPTQIDHTLGVVKSYSSRVGNGPMPTEEKETDKYPFEVLEGPLPFGKRRLGWFDVVMVKESIRLNGIDSIAVTKLDVLDRFDEIKICVGYELNGKRVDNLPHVEEDFKALKPIYETLPGWKKSLRGVLSFEDLPVNAKHYLLCLESLCGVPISMISMGPERECTVMMRDLFS